MNIKTLLLKRDILLFVSSLTHAQVNVDSSELIY